MKSLTRRLYGIKAAYDARNDDTGLLCRQASYDGCHVLKLQKPAWASDATAGSGDAGIFFAIWVNDAIRRQRAYYNIHALKLRHLDRYQITSRDFAAAFRGRFKEVQRDWPNVSIDYGPQNLMQGWIAIDEETFEADALKLMVRFDKISPIIDRLLADRGRR